MPMQSTLPMQCKVAKASMKYHRGAKGKCFTSLTPIRDATTQAFQEYQKKNASKIPPKQFMAMIAERKQVQPIVIANTDNHTSIANCIRKIVDYLDRLEQWASLGNIMPRNITQDTVTYYIDNISKLLINLLSLTLDKTVSQVTAMSNFLENIYQDLSPVGITRCVNGIAPQLSLILSMYVEKPYSLSNKK